MDKGGTITWYLAADDADFLNAMRRARAESKLTADDVDRNLNKGTANAKQSLSELTNRTDALTSSLKTNKNEAATAGTKYNSLRDALESINNKTSPLVSSLATADDRSRNLRGSFANLENSTNGLQRSIGGLALRNFTNDLFENKKQTDRADRGFKSLGLSLKDFHQNLGRSATAFRNFQIALRGFELSSLIIGASIATGAIIELVGALTALGGLLLIAPAGIAAFGSAIGTLSVATSGVADSFKALTKQTAGVGAASSLARKQNDLMRNSMKQDEALTKRLTDLKQQYSDVVKELAQVRMKELNEQIFKGVEAWSKITDAASDYLDISKSLTDLSQDVTTAQNALNTAVANYGGSSIQAIKASRDLFEAQAKVASANSRLDTQYSSIKDSVKDLATNINSLRKANRNEMTASLLNLKALRLDKQARGESTTEISKMIDLLDELIDIKDTKLTVNPDIKGAQSALSDLKEQFPDIATAAKTASSDAEKSLSKSLKQIAESMNDVRKERVELKKELAQNLAETSAASAAAAVDPFKGLSANAKKFVLALKEVRDGFQPIKEFVQDNFFAGLDTAIREVASTSFPILKTGLGQIASAMNSVLKETARVVQQPFFTGAVSKSMAVTAQATNNLRGSVEPLARVFTDLVNIGNPYIIMMSDWIVKQLQLASSFTGSTEGQKKLNDAISLGVSAMQQIGGLIKEVTGLFLDLFKVSNEAGISFIGTITDIVKKMREYIATEEGQNRLKALFEVTNTVFRALADTVGVFVGAILQLIEAYNNLDDPMKKILTNVLVFSAIATPILTFVSALYSSLNLVVASVREGFQALAAVAKVVGINFDGLGKVFTRLAKHPLFLVLGALALVFTYLGTQTMVFQDAIKQLQPAFAKFSKALSPVLDALGKIAAQFTEALLPVIPVVAEAFGQILTALLPLIPVILQIVTALLPVFVTLLQATVAVVQILIPIFNVLVQIISVVLVAAINVAIAIIKVLVDTILGVGKSFSTTWDVIVFAWNQAGIFFTGVWKSIASAFASVFTFFSELFKRAWNVVKSIWSVTAAFFQGVWSGIKSSFTAVVEFFRNLFQSAYDGVKKIWNMASGFFKGIWQKIVDSFKGAIDLGKNIVRGLWDGINSMGDWIGEKLKGFGDGVLNGIKDFFGIKSPSRLMRDEVGKMLGLGIASGITESTTAAVRAAQSASSKITSGFDARKLSTDFSVQANAMFSSQFAPAVIDSSNPNAVSPGTSVTINQTNEVHSDLDMEQVNRNLTWELSKI